MKLLASDRAITTRQDERTHVLEQGQEQGQGWGRFPEQEQEWRMSDGGVEYAVRLLDWNDLPGQTAYQQVRGEVFVGERGWDLPLDTEGRESDRYDVGGGQAIKVYGVLAAPDQARGGDEELIGGVRVFQLRHWDDSMLRHEFRKAGMFPSEVLDDLELRFDARKMVELTRLCVRPRRRHTLPKRGLRPTPPSYDLGIARDLVYAGAYAGAEAEGRRYALGVTDGLYLRVMQRSHFVFDTLFDGGMHRRGGYGLVLIDLVATVRAIHACGETARAERMLLCCERRWL